MSCIVAALAVSVSPASANQTLTAALVHPPLSKFCGQTQPTFAPLSRLTARTASVARGAGADVAREPGSADTAVEVPASAQGKGGKAFKATVSVYFHVVYDPAIPASNVSDTAISEQMTVLNMGYAGFEGGFDTGFRFKLVGVDRTANAAWFNAAPGSKEEDAMKQALRRGDASDFNVYATTASFYLGWSYFPSTYKTKPWLDGLVIDWESMPGTSTRYAGRYDLGKTATHEAGHWFGLYHVFQGGCNNWGDYVADTPAQLIATRGCPEGQDSCTKDPGIDSIHNYMDYSYDSCYNQFTVGQAARMQDQWLFFRANGGTTTPAQG